MHRILVTGSHGHIGSHLVRHLSSESVGEVFGLDLGHAPDEHAFTMGFAPEGAYFRCDISEFRQLQRVISHVRPTLVFNAAAEFGRWNGEDYYETLWRSNVIGFRHLLRLQEEYGFRLVHFSSSEVYGDYTGTMSEEVPDVTPIAQLNDYAITKRVNELQIANSCVRSRCAVVRLFNVYGPGERYSPYRSFVCRLLYACLHRLPFAVFRGHSRVNTYVSDAVAAIAALTRLPEQQFRGTYNIAAGEPTDNETVVRLALQLSSTAGEFIEYRDAEPRTTHHKHVCADAAEIALGLRPRVSLATGLKDTYEWLRQTYKTVAGANHVSATSSFSTVHK